MQSIASRATVMLQTIAFNCIGISDTLAKWASGHKIELQFIQPEWPMQNSYGAAKTAKNHASIISREIGFDPAECH
jgi:hypothetical protein